MPAPTPRQRLLAAARAVGATIEWSESARAVDASVDAPPGKVWNSNFCHMLSRATYKRERKWVGEMVDDLLGEIAMGLVECPDHECETCHEPE